MAKKLRRWWKRWKVLHLPVKPEDFTDAPRPTADELLRRLKKKGAI